MSQAICTMEFVLSLFHPLSPPPLSLTCPVPHDIPLLVVLPAWPDVHVALGAPAPCARGVDGDMQLQRGHRVAAKKTVQDAAREGQQSYRRTHKRERMERDGGIVPLNPSTCMHARDACTDPLLYNAQLTTWLRLSCDATALVCCSLCCDPRSPPELRPVPHPVWEAGVGGRPGVELRGLEVAREGDEHVVSLQVLLRGGEGHVQGQGGEGRDGSRLRVTSKDLVSNECHVWRPVEVGARLSRVGRKLSRLCAA